MGKIQGSWIIWNAGISYHRVLTKGLFPHCRQLVRVGSGNSEPL